MRKRRVDLQSLYLSESWPVPMDSRFIAGRQYLAFDTRSEIGSTIALDIVVINQYFCTQYESTV
jgi:hypothetical protein